MVHVCFRSVSHFSPPVNLLLLPYMISEWLLVSALMSQPLPTFAYLLFPNPISSTLNTFSFSLFLGSYSSSFIAPSRSAYEWPSHFTSCRGSFFLDTYCPSIVRPLLRLPRSLQLEHRYTQIHTHKGSHGVFLNEALPAGLCVWSRASTLPLQTTTV